MNTAIKKFLITKNKKMASKLPRLFNPKFKSILIGYSLFSIFFTSCNIDDHETKQTPLVFISEEYKPFNYTENSSPAGVATDLLNVICKLLNLKFEIEFKDWNQGYNETLNTDNTVLFSTVLNSTRKDLFKWAGPYASIDWNFYTASGSSVRISDMDDAKTLARIGVISNYAIEEYLVEQGFTNLVYCTDLDDAMTKLLANEIDAFPSDRYTTKATLEKLGHSTFSVTSQLTIKTELIYFAFNKNTSDEVIADFQNAIDQCKANGLLKQLSQKYLNTSEYPDVMQIYTESYPPLTYMTSYGEITGFGTDVVKEIMARNNLYVPIKMSSWSNGYQLALINPNFCLFTMDKTDIRKDLFQWVGPIGTNTTWFYTKAGSGISISSLADAKALGKIGTVSSWFSTQYLQQQGFTNLVYESDPAVMTEKLMTGQVDAFVCTDITFPDILRDLGYEYSTVTPAFSLMASDFYIALSTNTPASLVNTWQSTLDEMKSDGTYSAISGKWFPNK